MVQKSMRTQADKPISIMKLPCILKKLPIIIEYVLQIIYELSNWVVSVQIENGEIKYST